MTRVAALDCGTNSLRLLVADVVDGSLVDVVRQMEVVRLGQGVDRTGRFDPAALERTLAVTARYADTCRDLGVERVRFVATSASRDASNADELVRGVRERLGVDPEVIAGVEEAALSFTGAVGGLADRHPAPFLVVDLGGGSTELVLGTAAGVQAARSVDVGCVRLTERHGLATGDGVPSSDQRQGVEADVAAALDLAAAVVPLADTATLVGVAGTVTTVTAHALRLPGYVPDRIHGAALPVEQVLAACDDLVSMPRAARAELPYMHPGRVDVIAGGALVWAAVVRRVVDASGVDVVVASEHDILDGIALALAG